MSKSNIVLILLCLTLAVAGINIGLEIDSQLSKHDESSCTSGIIKERGERLKPASDNINEVMSYYIIECPDGSMDEVEAFKMFPLESKIKKEWVKQ